MTRKKDSSESSNDDRLDYIEIDDRETLWALKQKKLKKQRWEDDEWYTDSQDPRTN